MDTLETIWRMETQGQENKHFTPTITTNGVTQWHFQFTPTYTFHESCQKPCTVRDIYILVSELSTGKPKFKIEVENDQQTGTC